MARELAYTQTMDNQMKLSNFRKILQKGVPLSAVVTLSTTRCTVTRATVNISTTQLQNGESL